MKKYCYYCKNVRTSDEHVPPKCIFPEQKASSVDYRKNLITVPSCDEHNLKKAGTDERLRQILVGSAFTNSTGQGLLPGKWKRTFDENRKLSREFFNGEPTQYKLDYEGEYQDGLLVKQNFEDVDQSLSLICAGLYFHETGERLTGTPNIITGFMLYLDKSIQRANETEIGRVRNYFLGRERIGENPDVFFYQRKYTPNLKTFYLVFYGFNEILVRFQQ